MDFIPRVTFVMPAYNAAPYIGRAIDSILAQTCGEWRLIIINDGSTDETKNIARDYANADNRIQIMDMPAPSGCAYQPRRRGIESATTEFVAPLDADDWIAPDYLQLLIDRQGAANADAVFPTMYRISNENGSEAERFVPQPGFPLYTRTVTGRNCVAYTLDGWRMGFNGGIINRDALLRAQRAMGDGAKDVYSDELLTRHLLLELSAVTVSEARYFYFIHPASITHRPTARTLEYLNNNITLLDFCRHHYGQDSEEYLLAQRQNFHGIFEALRHINRPDMPPAERRKGLAMARTALKAADLPYLRGKVSPRYHLLLRTAGLRARHLLRLLDNTILSD